MCRTIEPRRYTRMLVENVLARHWSSHITATPRSRSREDRRLACRKDPLRGSDAVTTGRRRGSSRRVLSRLHAAQNECEEPYAPLEPERFVLDRTSEERALVIETGAIGRQANGAVLARQGDTVDHHTVLTLLSIPLLGDLRNSMLQTRRQFAGLHSVDGGLR